MRMWRIAAIAALGFTSFAAENVAPTKAELEEMYNAAYRAFDSNKFSEALKQLDAIDARQPDLAASKNLRGVILMRQGKYDEAETALQDAARIDPKFWNARFNLAEIPFLKKDWAEARRRFEQLLASGESDLAKEASQLIQYKILLTYLLEGNQSMVDSLQAKLELSPDTPAVDYVKAAVALQQKNQKEAQDWIQAAEKNFSPQLNKLFAESLYEIGWLQKRAGEGRPSLPLMTAAERTEKTKAAARAKFEQAQQALRQRDLAGALKLVDEADQIDPNQPATLNLRGEILMQQGKFDEAESAFKKAAKLDPKLREAQYNLAQVPFKKKEYAKARERFEALYRRTPGGDRNQAAEIIKFKIYMTLLLEGKESRAHEMMEEFQFTGDTPALYYAQAAWEYKHNNAEKAADWTSSAKKIYSPALNEIFADAFYDVGWMQRPEVASSAPTPTFDASGAVASQGEGAPAVEPSPIPESVFAANNAGASRGDSLALAGSVSTPAAGMQIGETTGLDSSQPDTQASASSAASAETQPEQPPAQSPAGGQSTTIAKAAGATTSQTDQSPAVQTSPSANPAAAGAPASVASPRAAGTANRRIWVVAALLLTAALLLAWAIVPRLRRYSFTAPLSRHAERPAIFSRPQLVPARNDRVPTNGFVGGPRQVSLQLKAWNPGVGSTVSLPSRMSAVNRASPFSAKTSPKPAYAEPVREESHSVLESAVGPVVEQMLEPAQAVMPAVASEPVEARAATGEWVDDSPREWQTATETSEPVGEAVIPAQASIESSPETLETALPSETSDDGFGAAGPASDTPENPAGFAFQHPEQEAAVVSETVSTAGEFAATEADIPLSSISSQNPPEPAPTTPATMPETTQTPTAPVNKAPAPPVVKPQQPAATMQTSVQLTFSFEIVAMQLTPSFKMGVLKVRPISKLVTMRLPAAQRAQSALNLQVGFEIAKIQPVGGALGTIRVVPSQQQRPAMGGMPSFSVAGLQIVPNSETAPVQLTPSQQARAAVLVTVPFQIATLEFSPSLEIASVILNSNSKQVVVQLPGAGPGPAEGAPMFEIANLELGEGGDIALMQLNLLGGPKRA